MTKKPSEQEKAAQPKPLRVERVAIDELKLDPKNARLHPERNLTAIRASLERFGQQKPIVVKKDGTVIAGNGTLEAARALGWTHLDVVKTDLDGKDAVAFGIADNRTGELSEWNVQELGAMLSDMKVEGDEIVGWSDRELDRFLSSIAPPEAPASFATVDESIETHYECPKCHYQWSGKASPQDV